jgi:hypothetical protein
VGREVPHNLFNAPTVEDVPHDGNNLQVRYSDILA